MLGAYPPRNRPRYHIATAPQRCEGVPGFLRRQLGKPLDDVALERTVKNVDHDERWVGLVGHRAIPFVSATPVSDHTMAALNGSIAGPVNCNGFAECLGSSQRRNRRALAFHGLRARRRSGDGGDDKGRRQAAECGFRRCGAPLRAALRLGRLPAPSRRQLLDRVLGGHGGGAAAPTAKRWRTFPGGALSNGKGAGRRSAVQFSLCKEFLFPGTS